MTRKTVVFLLMPLMFLMTAIVQSQTKVAQAGLTFLKIGAGARAAAMGGSYAALGKDIGTIFFNPAGLVYIERAEFAASYTDWIADIKHNAIAAAYTVKGIGTFGLSFISMDYGSDIKVTTVDLNPANEFGYQGGTRFGGDPIGITEFALGLSYSRRFTDRFSLGATVRYVYQSLGNNTIVLDGEEQSRKNDINGVAFDIGTLYSTGIRDLYVGFSMTNFSKDFQYEIESFQLPLTFRIGLAMSVWESGPSRLALSVDATHPRDFDEQVHFGGEYWFQERLALRGGYKLNYDSESWTAGAGLKQGIGSGNTNLAADYAYSAFDSIFGAVHRVTLGFTF